MIEDTRPYAFGDYLGCPLKRRLNILIKRRRLGSLVSSYGNENWEFSEVMGSWLHGLPQSTTFPLRDQSANITGCCRQDQLLATGPLLYENGGRGSPLSSRVPDVADPQAGSVVDATGVRAGRRSMRHSRCTGWRGDFTCGSSADSWWACSTAIRPLGANQFHGSSGSVARILTDLPFRSAI